MIYGTIGSRRVGLTKLTKEKMSKYLLNHLYKAFLGVNPTEIMIKEEVTTEDTTCEVVESIKLNPDSFSQEERSSLSQPYTFEVPAK